MLKSNDVVEVFFDSVDSFTSCDSFLSIEEECLELDYRIWNSEPVSVVERRERFVRGMGFSEFCTQGANEERLKNVGLERLAECTSAVSQSFEGVASCSGREMDDENGLVRNELVQLRPSNAQQLMERESTVDGANHYEELATSNKENKKWWNRFLRKKMKGDIQKPGGSIRDCKANRMKMGHNKKRCKEFTAVYMGQQIQAHKGFIWTMKFSPDGQYLASGGEDGVVRIWRVSSIDTTTKCFTPKDASKFVHKSKAFKLIPGKNISKPASVIIPPKVFKIDESPLVEFHGHTDDVLDLCWSKSNCLLSSSKDKTVRLWQVGSDKCLQVFHHNNYVTCIQFNPIDNGYFISGSIDGKVRVWGLSESRVVDWVDVRDIITAICYQPEGQGFVVGCVSGHCRFYDASGNHLQLNAQICVQGQKKSSNNRITGFQFSPEDAQKVMITSADSKVRIFDGHDVIQKYRGLRKSGSQMSASFTSNGRHIISVGEDSRVYVWNYDGLCAASSKQPKSIRSCEHFFFEGVSVAIPWLGMKHEWMNSKVQSSAQKLDNLVTKSLLQDLARFSLGGWFSMDGRLRGLATWPEEKLPLWSVPIGEDNRHHPYHDYGCEQDQIPHYNWDQQQGHDSHNNHSALSSTWGLVIVTGGCDGVIRTFHNYGLPARL